MTLGVMYLNGQKLVLNGSDIYVGEDCVRPTGVKIPKETAIWEGDYWLTITYSNRFKMDLPLIYNDFDTLAVISGNKRFDGVRQHNGNTEADTEACQLMGLGRSDSGVWRSNDAMSLYLPFIKKLVADNGGKIPYKVINQQP